MLLTGLLAFGGLILASNPKVLPAAACLYNPCVFGALVCYVLLCYGGGFGTMPSFVLDIFGPKLMAVVYGTILTAWSAAGIVGPLLFAHLKDLYKTDPTTGATVSFLTAGGFLLLGLVCSLFVSNKPLSLKSETPV
jgi:MFS transporter, OFA family, oxalate/formate antiporter